MKLKITKSKWQQIIQLTLFILYANGWGTTALASADNASVESQTWRVEYLNDAVFDKDNKISSGISIQKHSAVAESWDALKDVPKFIINWGKAIPTLTKEGLFYRAGIAIGQVIQTPDDLSRSDLIEEDVPYAGALTVQSSWYAYNNNEFRGFEITVGIIGPLSLAEPTQKVLHELIDVTHPQGWDNQLETEPVININYMRKQKLWRSGTPSDLSYDISINGNVGLGNLFTLGSMSLEMRFGNNMPGGFAYIPDPIGVSMHYLASLRPANPNKASFYITLVFSSSLYVHSIFLDGNTFRDSHSIDKEPLVGFVIAALHYEKRTWGIHFTIIESSNNVIPGISPSNNRERLGTIDLEWRF